MEWLEWFFGAVARRAPISIQVETTRYLIGAVGTWLIVWVLLGTALKGRKIRKAVKRAVQIRRELFYSGSTVLVFMLMGVLSMKARPRGGSASIPTFQTMAGPISPSQSRGSQFFTTPISTGPIG